MPLTSPSRLREGRTRSRPGRAMREQSSAIHALIMPNRYAPSPLVPRDPSAGRVISRISAIGRSPAIFGELPFQGPAASAEPITPLRMKPISNRLLEKSTVGKKPGQTSVILGTRSAQKNSRENCDGGAGTVAIQHPAVRFQFYRSRSGVANVFLIRRFAFRRFGKAPPNGTFTIRTFSHGLKP